jgi:hypothetical protein
MEKEPGGGCYSLYSRTAALHDITKQGLSLIRLERIKKKFPPRNTSNTTRPQEKSEEKKTFETDFGLFFHKNKLMEHL